MEDLFFSLEIEFDSEEEAEIVYRSILLEHLDTQIKSRSNMEVKGRTLKVETYAKDLSILKASLYSYLRWIKVSESIYKMISKK
ncbi:MAG TPA: KEOPS complex Pcc1-like subunit [Methanothermococcus okinawensis]|uniref:KEOPS complex Pcc1-like subunit n=1 Tax=Methanothermococcus okinawensis TaxID=155863 RepID=A0A832ZJS1_9EURY|nr:KEOPS complex Pcc1-like subunit [Methanothermococcus okinawensis]HIP91439.1 KEOPS complex Pcc1-like subunit [Methanothermococcus okinawensis]